MMTNKEIGKIFRDSRESREINLEDAYEMSRIHPNIIKNLEEGFFDKIERPYIRSFLKKYSEFLNLDPADILKKYDAGSFLNVSAKEFSATPEKKKENKQKKENPPEILKKKIINAAVVFFSIITVVLIFVLIGLIRDRVEIAKNRRQLAVADTKKTSIQDKQKRTVLNDSAQKKDSVINAELQVNLELQAKGEVWVQVNGGDKVLFAGIMNKGAVKTWSSNSDLTVWTGKANMLDFTVNGHHAGVVAAGVVKDIKVSKKGVRIGDNWVAHFG
ncbi:MAG: RodZ domain-containing protein [Candidatus Omnitrophota bacterium]